MKSDRTLTLITIATFILVFFIWMHTIQEGKVILTSGNRELSKEVNDVPYYSDENDFDTSTKEKKEDKEDKKK